MAGPFIAYCYRSGQVRIGERCPEGAIALVTWPSYRALRRVVDVAARLAYDGRTRLVPGIPEAPDDEAARAAAERFADQLLRRLEGRRPVFIDTSPTPEFLASIGLGGAAS